MTFEFWVDTGADTCCIGGGFLVLSKTGRYTTLRGYSDTGAEESVPIVTGATAVDVKGITYILIINEALYLGSQQHTSLLDLNQVRNAGHQADDIPHFLARRPSIFGIDTVDGIHIPFQLKGKSALLYVRTPTTSEMENCRHIELTSSTPWDPAGSDWQTTETAFESSHN